MTTTLFDPETTRPITCPTCGATRLNGQPVPIVTCRYDLQTHLPLHERDHPNRPRNCLNTHQPQNAELPY